MRTDTESLESFPKNKINLFENRINIIPFKNAHNSNLIVSSFTDFNLSHKIHKLSFETEIFIVFKFICFLPFFVISSRVERR